MGNCNGVFAACCGDSDSIKKVEREAMSKAVEINE